MEQDDFRKLVNSSTARAGATSTSNKRPRDRAFGSGRHNSTASATSFLAPRTKRNATASTVSFAGRASTADDKGKLTKTLLADGYTDRTKQRQDDSSKDGVQDEIDQLKMDLKDKKITHKEYLERVETFAKGEFSQSGVVRGLDRKLLERVRAGEDVLGLQPEGASAATEKELDQALEKLEWTAKDKVGSDAVPSQSAVPRTQHNARDAILARMKMSKSANMAPAKAEAAAQVKSAPGFIPITKRNKDGTTTESFVENGKKVKIIRDDTGKILKKLVKKIEAAKPIEPESSLKNAAAVVKPEARNTVPEPVIEDVPPEDDDGDIFDDVGEYDPYTTESVVVSTTTNNTPQNDEKREGAQRRRNYFTTTAHPKHKLSEVENGEREEGEAGEEISVDAAEFLRQNKAALEKAARIVDAQEKAERDRLLAKQKRDAGFGLVFRDADAYAGDLRDVPEDDEIYDKKRDGPQRGHVKDPGNRKD